MKQKNDKIEFNINCQSTYSSLCYGIEFALGDLQKISKYFLLFDKIDECFADFKQKIDSKNYEIILNEIEEKIIIKFITNIANRDFNLDFPIKKTEQEKTYCKFIFQNPNKNDDEYSSINYIEKLDKYLDKKFEMFERSINFRNNESGTDSENDNEKKIRNKKEKLFEKSTIIENDFERRLLENFIKENDKTKIEICPVLLFK